MEEELDREQKTILIVDDEQPIREILVYNLKKEGYNVIEASDGIAALNLALEKYPDLILLDIMLPKMDGLSVCKRIKNSYNVPILMLTAKDSEIDKILGINKQESKSEKSVLYVFNILWENGYYPKIEYIEQSWDSEMSIEKSCEVYINRCKAKYDIDENQEHIIKKYIEEISINGLIYEKINTIKAVVYWKN